MNNQTMLLNYTMTSIPNEIWLGMLPILFLSLGALITLLTAPSKNGQSTSFVITLISLIAAFIASLFNFYNLSIPLSYADGMLMFDSLSLFSTSALCLGAILSSFNFYGNAVGKDQIQNEIFPLLLLSLIGMLFLVSTNHLIMMFVALEIMSLAVYVLVSMRRTTKISSEAGLKYFILGGAASCFFLYGSALLLGHYGSFNLTTLSQAESSSLLTLVGSMLILIAVLFKIGAFPLHAWVPDIYQGAASPITGFMAATVKFTGFLLLIRIAESLFTSPFFIVIGIVAILTMIYGNVMALRQENLKRMMAYSSIAHTGYILIGLLAAEENLIIGHRHYRHLTLYIFLVLGFCYFIPLPR
jgi:NADH-quinone oxidoreductase subunit N